MKSFYIFLFVVKVFLTKTQERKKINKNMVNDIARDETQEIKINKKQYGLVYTEDVIRNLTQIKCNNIFWDFFRKKANLQTIIIESSRHLRFIFRNKISYNTDQKKFNTKNEILNDFIFVVVTVHFYFRVAAANIHLTLKLTETRRQVV